MPNAVRTDLTADEFISNAEHLECCTVHTGGGTDIPLDELIARSNELIATVRHYLDTVQTLTETARHILEGGITQLQNAIAQSDAALISQYMSELKRNYDVLSALYPPPNQPAEPTVNRHSPTDKSESCAALKLPSNGILNKSGIDSIFI